MTRAPKAAAAVASYVEIHRDRFLSELMDLCRIPSVAAEGRGLDDAARWVATRLERLGATVTQIEIDGSPPMLFGEIGDGPPEKSLLIYNHYDVQPADPLELWTSDPFNPTVREGRLFARGVADNKANLLSRIHAIEAWQAQMGPLPVRVRWLIEGEEEVGSPHLDALAHRHGDLWRDSAGCLWETGYKDQAGRMVMYAGCKGLAAFELRVRTAPGDKHSALATLIPNPAWRLVWALGSFKGPDEDIRIRGLADHVRPPTDEDLRHLEGLPFDPAAFRDVHGIEAFAGDTGDTDALVRHLFSPTCNIAGFHSGYGGPGTKTVLPAVAQAKLDFRLVPDLTPELVADLLRNHLDRHGFTDVEIEVLAGERPVAGRLDSPLVSAAESAVATVTGIDPVVWPHMAATGPMYPVTARFGLPVVGFGTGYFGSNTHAPDENVRLADYFEGIQVMAEFLSRFARQGPQGSPAADRPAG